ncbi:MAG: hypothetical protein SCARUB_01239 [Candidatus Scalindua rubra]|uniref:Uncharacterized protein n=1 Tax=Candidatus Scalindua rubra TaxID=1872076 RepID=A0A1E3XDG1_9BACT|nr:MAG: hypothetical protein SCARUB_01239 [Candidatus Scalindua rubra]
MRKIFMILFLIIFTSGCLDTSYVKRVSMSPSYVKRANTILYEPDLTLSQKINHLRALDAEAKEQGENLDSLLLFSSFLTKRFEKK